MFGQSIKVKSNILSGIDLFSSEGSFLFSLFGSKVVASIMIKIKTKIKSPSSRWIFFIFIIDLLEF